MQRSDVAHAFMQEFEHDLPKPPPPPELPNYDEEVTGAEYQRHSIVVKLHALRYVSSVGVISESRLNALIVGNRSSLLQKRRCYVNWIIFVRNTENATIECLWAEYQFSRNEYVKNKMDEIKTRYYKTYGIDLHTNLKKDEAYYTEKLELEFDKEWKKEREKMHEEQLSQYQLIFDNHYMQIHLDLEKRFVPSVRQRT